jgi:hypothetical protein
MAKDKSILGKLGGLYEKFAFQSPVAHFGGKALIPDEKKRHEIYGGIAAGTGAALTGGALLGAAPAASSATAPAAASTAATTGAQAAQGFDWSKLAGNVLSDKTKRMEQESGQGSSYMTPLQRRQQMMRSQAYQGGY